MILCLNVTAQGIGFPFLFSLEVKLKFYRWNGSEWATYILQLPTDEHFSPFMVHNIKNKNIVISIIAITIITRSVTFQYASSYNVKSCPL